MRKTYITALISTLILSLSVNAWAYPPLSETFYYEDDFPLVSCGAYEVRTLALTKEKDTTFFDRDGNPVRLRISFSVRGAIYYNSVNPDIYIQQGASGTGENTQVWVDLVTGALQFTGLPLRITLKGIGVLYLKAGRNYIDGENSAVSGIVIFPEAGTGSALCEALAP